MNELELIKKYEHIILDVIRIYFKRRGDFFKKDMMQEGYIGLIKAIRSYDEKKHKSLTGYIYNLVRLEIFRAIVNNGAFIRIPERSLTRLHKLNRGETTNDPVAKWTKVVNKKVYSISDVSIDKSINYIDEEMDREFLNILSDTKLYRNPIQEEILKECFFSDNSHIGAKVAKKFNVTRAYVSLQKTELIDRLKNRLIVSGDV